MRYNCLPLQIIRARTLLFCLCAFFDCISQGNLFAQKEGNIWYFGHNAGLDFKTGAPVPLTNGQLYTNEGCSSISDSSGRILFYTDGITVYNRKNLVMPNGFGLMGNSSSTQSGVIVPVPANPSAYYIFTVDKEGGANGFRYSKVDMSKDGGNGDIVEKNVLLFTPSTEKITAVKHFNGIDIWVIGHKFNSDSFITYKIDRNGLTTGTVVSKCGSVHSGFTSNAIGYMKVSPDATKIAMAVNGSNTVEVFDFDASTGLLSNARTIKDTMFTGGPYGIEFSPDGSRFYVTTAYGGQKLIQFDASANSAETMLNSAVVIFQGSNVFPSGLQLGPNKKIYCALADNDSVGVIEYPNSPGLACGYRNNGVYLDGKKCWLGLPTFIQSYFNPPQIIYQYPCVGTETKFSLSYNTVDSAKWYFGDTITGSYDTSFSFNPQHMFSAAGTFNVRCIVRRGKVTDTSVKIITIEYPPVHAPTKEGAICQLKSARLRAPLVNNRYAWSNGSTDSVIQADSPGIYWVKITDGLGCACTDTFIVKVRPLPEMNLPRDTSVCNVKSYKIVPDIPVLGTLRWQDNSGNSSYAATRSGKYWLVDSNGCGVISDTMVLALLHKPDIDLGHDTLLCNGGKYRLTAYSPGCVYTWQDGSKDSFYEAASSGIFWVRAGNYCGVGSDSIHISIQKPPIVNFAKDTTVCIHDSIVLDAYNTGSRYHWQDSSSGPRLTVKRPGLFTVKVNNNCGSVENSIRVDYQDCNCYEYIPNAFTPNNDGVNDVFLMSSCIPYAYSMKIYNGWGEMVFSGDDVAKGWDGTFHNENCPQGVYFYTVYIRNRSNDDEYKSGNILLMR